MRLVKNELYATEAGTLRPRATDDIEEMSVGLVFRSVGYQGVPLPDLPFDERWGVILNQKGRVLNPETSQPKPGQYTSGWIKRGPTGVIGTNKSDALETVRCMVEDIHDDVYLHPSQPEADAADHVIRQRQHDVVTYTDWLRLNRIEIAKAQALGKPRVKFTRIEDMLAVQKEYSLA